MKDIVLKTGIAEFKIRKILDLLSLQSNIVNAKLRFPPSSLAIDHYFKPVIKIGNNYKIFPKSIAALGCLNTVCNSITNPNGKWSNPLDSELGYAVEDFLRNAFISKGIKIFHGDRAGGESDLEADLICETDDTIFIFEIKKKGLTRQAQAGDEVKLLIDLADSVLATHVQAMRIENILKNHETLTLVHKDTVHHLRLSERSVQRISVSLHDFGALQDKTVLQSLLTIATHTDMRHPVSSEDKKLEKWRSNSKELRRLAEENGELGVTGRMPFHNSLFMSIPQIIMILEQSENEFDFFKHVKSFVSSSTGSRDTYTEFVNRLNFIKRCKAEGLAI